MTDTEAEKDVREELKYNGSNLADLASDLVLIATYVRRNGSYNVDEVVSNYPHRIAREVIDDYNRGVINADNFDSKFKLIIFEESEMGHKYSENEQKILETGLKGIMEREDTLTLEEKLRPYIIK